MTFSLYKMKKYPSSHMHCGILFISNALSYLISLCILPDKKIWCKFGINSKLISINYRKQQNLTSAMVSKMEWTAWACVQQKHISHLASNPSKDHSQNRKWAEMWSTRYLITMLKQQQYLILLWSEMEIFSVDRVWSWSFSRTGRRVFLSY